MENKSQAGGILSIVSGACGFLYLGGALLSNYALRALFNQTITPESTAPPEEFITFMTIFYVAIGLFFALIGILAIVGGIFALKKKLWGMALAGAIAGTITFFPCGIAATILTSMAKPEFETSPEKV